MLKKKIFSKNIHFSFPQNVQNQALYIMHTQYILLNKQMSVFQISPQANVSTWSLVLLTLIIRLPKGDCFCLLPTSVPLSLKPTQFLNFNDSVSSITQTPGLSILTPMYGSCYSLSIRCSPSNLTPLPPCSMAQRICYHQVILQPPTQVYLSPWQ